MTLSERFVVLSAPVASFVIGGMTTKRLVNDWLGVSDWIAVPLALVAGIVASIVGLLVGWFAYLNPRWDRQRALRKADDLDAITSWQREHTDPVLGTPRSYGEPVLNGNWRVSLKQFQGRVVIDPPQRLSGPIYLFAHIGPTGFSEQQRDFYRRLLSNQHLILDSFYPALNTAFHQEFSKQGDFPHTASLHGLEIGPMNGDEFGESIITLEYDQDAYVDVVVFQDKVKSVSFFM